MKQQRFDYQDLNFTVVAIPSSYYVEYKIYDIEGVTLEGTILWHRKDAQSSPCAVETLEEAEVYLHGEVKWDGCSNWAFDEQERVMLHGCSRRDLIRFGEIMGRCWDLTKELCLNWSE